MSTSINPAVRPVGLIVPDNDQNPKRIVTPYKAIKKGANGIVVARPIVQAKSPYDATILTLLEISLAT